MGVTIRDWTRLMYMIESERWNKQTESIAMAFNFAVITPNVITWNENRSLSKAYLIGEDGKRVVGKVAYDGTNREWLVWANDGRFWSSYGKTRIAAVLGARRDGII